MSIVKYVENCAIWFAKPYYQWLSSKNGKMTICISIDNDLGKSNDHQAFLKTVINRHWIKPS